MAENPRRQVYANPQVAAARSEVRSLDSEPGGVHTSWYPAQGLQGALSEGSAKGLEEQQRKSNRVSHFDDSKSCREESCLVKVRGRSKCFLVVVTGPLFQNRQGPSP